MTLLDEVVAAMDHADTARALDAITAAFHDDGALPDTITFANTMGEDAIRAQCQAFGLDDGEVIAFATARGAMIASTLLRTLGIPEAPQLVQFYGDMVGGGITVGFRVGLMLADRSAKGS